MLASGQAFSISSMFKGFMYLAYECLAFGHIILIGCAAAVSPAATIRNDSLEVIWNEQTKQVSVTHQPTGKEFVKSARMLGEITAVRPLRFYDKTLGEGQALEFNHPNGQLTRFAVCPRLPFVFVRATLRNSGLTRSNVQSSLVASCVVDWGCPLANIKTLGTGGLLDPDKNPGSYAWLAAVEPQSRNGVVAGWLTHNRGSGVLFSKLDNGRLLVEAQLDFGRLQLEPSELEELETLAIGYFDDARLGLEAWADTVAKVYEVKLPEQPAGYCTWYSRPHGGASDEKHLAELAEFAADELAPHGFSVVQIDDKWQAGESTNGPRRNFTTHDPRGPYPRGMKAAADHIKSLGFVPGLWFMPFAGTYYDPFFAEHQDWFVKRKDGKPYETKWGGTCLDMTHPGAREHLRSIVRRIAHEWGYRYFKIDGLWTGTGTPLRYVNSGYQTDGMGDAVFHNQAKTNIEAFRDGLKLVREAAGPDVFLLGCNAPQNMRSYGGAFGLVDAMRVGPDNGPEWKQLIRGPTFGSRHYFLHGRLWYNDPDPVYVRDSMPLKHAQMICSWVALTGQLYVNSDWLYELPPERLRILTRTLASHGLQARPVDLFEHDPPRIWTLIDDRHKPPRVSLGVFNWGEEAQVIESRCSALGLDDQVEYGAFDYWGDHFVSEFTGNLALRVPAQSCRILAVRARAKHPQLLSTSPHVTQGIVDVASETWDGSSRKLAGRSRVFGDDEYELRILLPDRKWRPSAVQATSNGGSPIRVSHTIEGELLRVRCAVAEATEFSWAISF
jgi:hypothetical protein